jgi:CRISPR type III-B/RAMP module RAMP protein Cmr1
METLTFNCKILTPMFLAGADGRTPELRAASIKGAMRFWWRACNGHLGLDDLRKQEQAIFGGVGPGDARRSGVVVRVREGQLVKAKDQFASNEKYVLSTPGTSKSANIFDYLAYGPVSHPPQVGHEYFRPNSTFGVTLNVRNSENKDGIIDAFKFFTVFGGLRLEES